MYVCICMYVCMYYVCMYLYVCMYYVCMCVCMYVCIVYICMYVCVMIRQHTSVGVVAGPDRHSHSVATHYNNVNNYSQRLPNLFPNGYNGPFLRG